MSTCYNHPRIEAVIHCKSCKLPSCSHCADSEYCSACARLRRYIELGYSGERRAELVPPPLARSRTKELMLARLQRQALDADAPSLRQRSGGRASGKARKTVQVSQPLAHPGLLPQLARQVRTKSAPAIGLAAVLAIGLVIGLLLGHSRPGLAVATNPEAERLTTTHPVPPVPAAVTGVGDDLHDASGARVVREYHPIFITVSLDRGKGRQRIASPLKRIFYAPAIAFVAGEPATTSQATGDVGAVVEAPIVATPEVRKGDESRVADQPDPTTLALAKRTSLEEAVRWSEPEDASAHRHVDGLVEVAGSPDEPAVREAVTAGAPLTLTTATVLPAR